MEKYTTGTLHRCHRIRWDGGEKPHKVKSCRVVALQEHRENIWMSFEQKVLNNPKTGLVGGYSGEWYGVSKSIQQKTVCQHPPIRPDSKTLYKSIGGKTILSQLWRISPSSHVVFGRALGIVPFLLVSHLFFFLGDVTKKLRHFTVGIYGLFLSYRFTSFPIKTTQCS